MIFGPSEFRLFELAIAECRKWKDTALIGILVIAIAFRLC
jgi:hypothetical protein